MISDATNRCGEQIADDYHNDLLVCNILSNKCCIYRQYERHPALRQGAEPIPGHSRRRGRKFAQVVAPADDV